MPNHDTSHCEACASPRGRLIRALADVSGDGSVKNHDALEMVYGELADEAIAKARAL